jgi:hypothetical protein
MTCLSCELRQHSQTHEEVNPSFGEYGSRPNPMRGVWAESTAAPNRNAGIRSRARDLVLVLLGVLGLVMKSQLARVGGPLVQDYGGNVAASFAVFFVLKLPVIRVRVRFATAAALALLVTELFEVTDGFGFMSNTYDPGDYLANAIGVGLALGVEAIILLGSRLRAGASANM